MNKELGTHEEINFFLEDVIEQIKYKPIHSEIEKELKGHIEDRTLEYMDMGIEEKEAAHKAIGQMGDGSSIGIMMNKTRHVKNHIPLLSMVLLAVLMGILGNVKMFKVLWDLEDFGVFDVVRIFRLEYFLWGLLVLLIIYYKGYVFVVKHAKLILVSFVTFCLMERLFELLNMYVIRRYHTNPVLRYGLLLLFCPMIVIAIYRWRSKGNKAILLSMILLLTMILLQYSTVSWFVLSAILILLITSIITIHYMISKGLILGNRKKLLTMSVVGFLLVIGIYGTVSFKDQLTNITLFFTPEKVATDYLDDGYNGVLIKELYSKAKLIGPINLSQDELLSYKTGDWFFDDMDVTEFPNYRYYIDHGLTLGEVLSDHYYNNYRFATWILHYGWIPAIILISFVLGMCGMLFVVTGKIKNKLGHILAFSCSVCLTIQTLLYLLGNLGHQYGSFSTLPFISEGYGSITVNMILVGLVLSAYRYDNVIKEDKYLNSIMKPSSI